MFVPFYFFLKMHSLDFEGGEKNYAFLKFIFVLFISSQVMMICNKLMIKSVP